MWEQIRSNRRASVVMILGMALLLMALGYVIAGAAQPKAAPFGILAALAAWLILWLVAATQGSSLLLGTMDATEITHDDVPMLDNVVEEMAIAAALPAKPKVYLIDHEAPNAFAVGSPGRSAVAVTTGLLARLNRDELQGVIAHEVGHIRNEDTRMLTQAGVLLGAIVLLSDAFLRGMRFSGARRRSSGRGGGQAQLVFLLVAVALAILAPIMAQVLYFACSRRREYLADATAARLTRYPEGLASALEKIAQPAGRMTGVNRVVAPMFIVNPLSGAGALNLFSTHPPIGERVRILRGMAGAAGLRAYEHAFRKATGRALIGGRTLGASDDAAVRAASPDAASGSGLGRLRQAVDVLHRRDGLLFLACPCGVRMKIPASLDAAEVACPRCGRRQAIPRPVEVAATLGAVTAAAERAQQAKAASGDAVLPVHLSPKRFRYVPGAWQSFRCDCGRAIQLSPTFGAGQVRCAGCGATIRVDRT